MNAGHDLPELAGIAETFELCSKRARVCALSTAEQRIDKVRRLISAVLRARPEIYEAAKLERGLSPPDMDAELVMLKFEADNIAANLEEWMTTRVVPPSLMTLGKTCYMRYEAKGNVLVLPSWNAPFVIGLLPTFGALAAGNAVILKPSEISSHSSRLMARIVAEALPQGDVQVVEGGAEAAQALMAKPFNHIFYIGNNHVGRIVMKAAAEHFASVTLEMGGKNPSIIGKSANIDDAALKTAWGRLCNAGQACIAPDYVLVHSSQHQQFCDKLVEEIARMYNPDGKGFELNPEYPRIINGRHFERIRGLIEDAQEKGAKVLCGAEWQEEDRYIAPTVVTDVTDDMKVMQEEIFGPVLAVVPYDTREDVIEKIRNRPKPLALYVFGKDREEIDFFINNTTAGSSAINHNVIQSGTNPHLAFGGVNSSGMGRMIGWNTFNEASNARSIVEEGPPVIEPRSLFPPLTDKYKSQLLQMIEGKPVPPMMVRMIHAVVKFVGIFKRG